MATAETLTSTSVPDPTAHLLSTNAPNAGVDGHATRPQEPAAAEPVVFDPAKHLAYTPPSKVHTMAELGYPESRGVSPIGVSEPFPLFSAEAIQNMRKEILTEEVFAKYRQSSDLALSTLRGYAAICAPFVYDTWRNPKTLAIVSQVAGVDLVPAMDCEIGHINLSIQSEEEKAKGLTAVSQEADEEDDNPIVDWHTDAYPFVCVTMLSDCKDMIGGETMIRKGNGEVIKIRCPQMGSSVILQGRYIEHKALRALGMTERITMVTSFRPRSPNLPDHTVLTTVRPVSDLGELYHQFAEYRFEILEDRLRNANKYMRDQKRANRPFNTRHLKQFIREQIEFLEHMDREIVEDDKVIKGVTDDSHLISEDLRLKSSKKRGLALAK